MRCSDLAAVRMGVIDLTEHKRSTMRIVKITINPGM